MPGAGEEIATIVVGLDGSVDSHEAVVWAAALAVPLDAEVVAVHALGMLDQLEPGGPVTIVPGPDRVDDPRSER